jgi:hypothetical protein
MISARLGSVFAPDRKSRRLRAAEIPARASGAARPRQAQVFMPPPRRARCRAAAIRPDPARIPCLARAYRDILPLTTGLLSCAAGQVNQSYPAMTPDPATTTAEPPRPWYRRASVAAAVLLLPYIVFGSNFACHRVLPVERLSWQEILLPASGAPIALLLVVLAFPQSSWQRRIALIVVGLLSLCAIVGTATRIKEHW